MPVERVLITPNLMRLKNSSGSVVFDTTNRYIKTDSGSSFSVTAVARAPFPIGNATLEDYGGYGIWKGMMINRSVNEIAGFPRVANRGTVIFKTGILVSGYGTGNYGGTTTPPGQEAMWTYIGPIFDVVKNNVVQKTYHLHRQLLFYEISSSEVTEYGKSGERFYISGTTTIVNNGFSFGDGQSLVVDSGDSIYIRFLRNHLQGDATFNGEYVVMYYSDDGTLPLAVTA
jgi:hypothetical protein